MRFGVLGPLTVWTTHGAVVAVPGLKVRLLLAALLLHEGQPVPADRLIDHLWGDAPPTNAAGALSAKVSQLRRVLAEAEPGGRELVRSPPPGYRLLADRDEVDACHFQRLVSDARGTQDVRSRVALFSAALALWRGPAFADFRDESFAAATIAGLEEQRLTALEDCLDDRLALGEHASVVGDLGDLLAREPLRERARGLHMRALYRAGRQSEALRSFDELRVRLRDELGLDPGPDLVTLHRAVLAHDPTLAVPPVAAVAPPRRPVDGVVTARPNLPTPLTELIGRDAAVAELVMELGRNRLVTLVGIGGVGKTRLAVEVARAGTSAYPDGVALVELAGVDRSDAPETVDALAGLVLAALDVRDATEAGGAVTPVDRLSRLLGDRRLLLVLDNCEHLVDPLADLTAALLGAAPGVRVLATSREPLGLAGEIVWAVPPLPVPDPADGTDLAALARSDAVRLFVARAAAADRGFALGVENAVPVATVCRRLDGIPLALELAATQVRGLGVRGLIAGLDDRFRLLGARHRGVPARQRTLLAMLDWSWQLLTEPERVVLRRLAAYADGCDVDAVRAVCAPDGVPAASIADLLARLVDRSLVVVAPREGTPRYRLLESVAAFGLDQLRAAGELEDVRSRAHRYQVELAERAHEGLPGPEQRLWLRRLDVEAANLRAALDAAVRQRDADLALRLANALSWYWFLRGRFAEARRWLAAALDCRPGGGAAAGARAAAWHLGFALLSGDVGDWVTRHRAVLRRYDDVDDPHGRLRALWFLAYAEVDLGDVTATGDLLDEVLAEARALPDEWVVAATLSLRAKHAHIRGDAPAVARDGAESAALFRRLGDRWGVLQATEWLGAQAGMAGDYEQANRLYEEGLRVAEDLGLRFEMSGQLCWLGWVALQRGDYSRARQLSGRGLGLATEQGSPLGIVFAELCLAAAARREGSLDTAEAHLENLLDAAGRQQDGPGQPLYLTGVLGELGYVAELRGDPRAALDWHLRAAEVAAELGAEQVPWQVLVGVAATGGRPQDAARLLGAAAAGREATGLPLALADRPDVERATALAVAALGDEDFTLAHEQGRRLSPEEIRHAVRAFSDDDAHRLAAASSGGRGIRWLGAQPGRPAVTGAPNRTPTPGE
ncbi:BTAD domain-containing putative transcriptional regulator [Micromonospora sp. NPDC049274]|uniref:BTAD domain-containing putative transcriptional regulator n=1 Tax=Micromonospora sp. NPDC049274 TaxID=3154829 RepID=UPI003436CFA4